MHFSRAVLVVISSAAAACSMSRVAAQPPRYDVVLTNGRIVDGTGAPWFRGDVAIKGDRIAAVGVVADAGSSPTIDATNLVIAPGFIDLLGQSEFNVLV